MNELIRDLAEHYSPARPEMAATPDRPFEVYDVMRETCPVKWVDRHPRVSGGDGPGWVLTRHRDVAAVLRDDDHFTSVGILGANEDDDIPTGPTTLDAVDPRTMARMAQRIPMLLDPPEFVPYRRMLTPLFTPKRMAAREEDTRALVNRLIDDFVTEGTCDFHEQLDKPLPGILTCRLLGLPTERWRSFADPIDEFVHREGAGAFAAVSAHYEDSPFARMQVPGMLAMLEIAEERRRAPRADVISELVHLELDGRPLGIYELGSALSILLSGGTETTTAALGSALVYLGRNPGVRAALVEEPGRIPHFAEEVLRCWPPIMTFFRIVKQPWSLDGHELRPGEVMYLVLAAANRDPEEFDEPHTSRYDRSPNHHTTFALGIHRCLGSSLARLELRVALEEVLRRIPDYELVEDQVDLLPHFPSSYGYRRITATFPRGRRTAA